MIACGVCLRESAEVKLWTELSSQAVGLVRTGKFFMIACMDHTLNCYTPKVFQKESVNDLVRFRSTNSFLSFSRLTDVTLF